MPFGQRADKGEPLISLALNTKLASNVFPSERTESNTDLSLLDQCFKLLASFLSVFEMSTAAVTECRWLWFLAAAWTFFGLRILERQAIPWCGWRLLRCWEVASPCSAYFSQKVSPDTKALIHRECLQRFTRVEAYDYSTSSRFGIFV